MYRPAHISSRVFSQAPNSQHTRYVLQFMPINITISGSNFGWGSCEYCCLSFKATARIQPHHQRLVLVVSALNSTVCLYSFRSNPYHNDWYTPQPVQPLLLKVISGSRLIAIFGQYRNIRGICATNVENRLSVETCSICAQSAKEDSMEKTRWPT